MTCNSGAFTTELHEVVSTAMADSCEPDTDMAIPATPIPHCGQLNIHTSTPSTPV